jgi:hypothetical protein
MSIQDGVTIRVAEGKNSLNLGGFAKGMTFGASLSPPEPVLPSQPGQTLCVIIPEDR